MQVPFIDLKRQQTSIRELVLEDWSQCLDDTCFVGGRFVSGLEKKLENLLGSPHVVSCANGTDALVLALIGAGVGPGDTVAIPDVTFWATFEAVVQVGARPILIDIDPGDLQMNVDELRTAHAEYGLAAAIPAHLYGWCTAKLGELRQFCRGQEIKLIEDAAQAFGVTWRGESIFSDADFATLSFYPAKVIGGCMDGGAISARHSSDADTLRQYANHGRSSHYGYEFVGYNSRMGDIQAAYLTRLLVHADTIISSRNEAIDIYRTHFEDAAMAGVELHLPPSDCRGNGYLLVATIDVDNAEDMVGRLSAMGVGAARTYPGTISSQPPALGCERVSELSNAARFCRSVINLPLFTGITEDEIEYSATMFFKALENL
jgi:dTDP-4-amino-4,6-dideoxygalactose transaminase